jgi:hypothetical protein
MQMIPVSSSAIRAIGYDTQAQRMSITFTQGTTYDHCGVPENVFKEFLYSFSKGNFYNRYMKDRYSC